VRLRVRRHPDAYSMKGGQTSSPGKPPYRLCLEAEGSSAGSGVRATAGARQLEAREPPICLLAESRATDLQASGSSAGSMEEAGAAML
jgi:hypothetical protein